MTSVNHSLFVHSPRTILTGSLSLSMYATVAYIRGRSVRVLLAPKTATLLYTGFPRYFAPYLSSYTSSYSTRRSQSGGNFLVIPKFYPSVHKSIKQFGYSFAFDAPTVWNARPEEIRSSPSLASFRKQLKTYLYTKAHPP